MSSQPCLSCEVLLGLGCQTSEKGPPKRATREDITLTMPKEVVGRMRSPRFCASVGCGFPPV